MANPMETPVAFHEYLTDANGAPCPVYKLLPDEKCPVCARNRLGISWTDLRSEVVSCLSCDFSEPRAYRPPPRTPAKAPTGGKP